VQKFSLYDVTNPNSPQAGIHYDGGGDDIALYDKYLITNYQGRVQIYDTDVTDNVVLVGEYSTLGSARAVDIIKEPGQLQNKLLIADGHNGFRIGPVLPVIVQIQSDFGYFETIPPSTIVNRTVNWSNSAGNNIEHVQCISTGGACSISNVNLVGGSATMTWITPAVNGDYMVRVYVGNQDYYMSDGRRVRVAN
jgi:hypothetical protein